MTEETSKAAKLSPYQSSFHAWLKRMYPDVNIDNIEKTSPRKRHEDGEKAPQESQIQVKVDYVKGKTVELAKTPPKTKPDRKALDAVNVIYSCSFCSAKFQSVADFTSHLWTKHQIEVKTDEAPAKRLKSAKKKFSCDLCEFISKTKPALANHMRKRHKAQL